MAALNDEAREAAVERLLASYWLDADKIKEADEWCAGSLSSSHYSELESVMADLHQVHPSDLLGSDVPPRLYSLAKQHHAARASALRDMAETDVGAEFAERERNRREAAADRMERAA